MLWNALIVINKYLLFHDSDSDQDAVMFGLDYVMSIGLYSALQSFSLEE